MGKHSHEKGATSACSKNSAPECAKHIQNNFVNKNRFSDNFRVICIGFLGMSAHSFSTSICAALATVTCK